MKKKTKKFGNKVAATSRRAATEGSQYGYMNLPKGISIFKEDPGGRALLDFMLYEVSDPNHPDRDDSLEIAGEGDLWYRRPFKIHRQVGSTNETEVCPTSFGRKCPICNYGVKRLREGAPKEETRAYYASKRNLYVVIPKGMDNYDEKPHLWNISHAMFQEMLDDEINENDEFGVFPDPEEGLSLRIRFKEKTIGKSKPFAETSRIDFEERDEPYDESILSKIPDLDKILRVKTFEQLEKAFFEMDDGDAVEPVEEVGKAEEPVEDEPPFDDDDDACVACGGTGTNSKGRKCRPCGGTGVKSMREEEEPEPAKEEKPAQTRKKESPKKSKGECEYGHVFGDDCEEFEECDDCAKWDACITKKEENA